MVTYSLDPVTAVLHIQPTSALSQTDFEEIAKTVDPFITNSGDLAGILVETPGFPGWTSFGAFAAHLRFVRDHHKHIKKIAIATDSALGNIAESLVSHFVSTEVKHFPASQADAARQWILEAS